MFLTLQPNFPTLNKIFHCYTVDRLSLFYGYYVLTQYQVTAFAHTDKKNENMGIIGTAKALFFM